MVYIFLADGFEEIEALTVVDVLRRADVPVRLVYVGSSSLVRGAHGITVRAELPVADAAVDAEACYVLPGGLPGVDNLEASERLSQLLQAADRAGALLCAICAAPRALGKLGLLNNVNYTCYPGMESQIAGGYYVGGSTVCADRRITGEGPGAAMDFALQILETLCGPETARTVRRDMCCRG